MRALNSNKVRMRQKFTIWMFSLVVVIVIYVVFVGVLIWGIADTFTVRDTMIPTLLPTLSPTPHPTPPPTRSPTRHPTWQPSSAPSGAPTCANPPGFMDVVWILDGSTSVALSGDAFANMTDFIDAFASRRVFGPNGTRMGAVEFSGMYLGSFLRKIIAVTNLTDDAAHFRSELGQMSAVAGGTTDTGNAINYVRTEMFTAANYRPGSKRIAVLLTDGNPSDSVGATTSTTINQANAAAMNLREEDNVYFVFIRIGTNYSPSYLTQEPNMAYIISDYTAESFRYLLDHEFFCFLVSDAPTTSSPTGSPTTSSPTDTPTGSPTNSPSTSSPTASPTGSPTSSPTTPTIPVPTQSPTACIPGAVTCCIAVVQRLAEVWANDNDLTPNIVAVETNPGTVASYLVSFTEPSSTAVFAIKGYETGETSIAGYASKCVCDRAGSPWTFESEAGTGWVSVNSNRSYYGYHTPILSDGWNLLDYSGASASAIVYPDGVIPPLLNTTVCGAQNMTNMFRHFQAFTDPRSEYWGFRKVVTQNVQCGTDAPIQSPTFLPTGPPTGSPTGSPTQCIPGTVTCCFGVLQRLVELWVDDMDLTPILSLVGGSNLTSLTYTATFTEPSGNAVLVAKGFEGSEVYSAGFRSKCVCDRPGSPWTFDSQIDTGWLSVSSTRIPSYQADSLRDGWNMLNYTGPSSAAVSYLGTANLLILDTAVCGGSNSSHALGHPQGLQSPRSWYWGLRRLVTQPVLCGTGAPIRSPTVHPTRSPSISPTNSPTGLP